MLKTTVFYILLFISIQSNATTVVLIHGLNSNYKTWYEHNTLDALLAAGFHDETKFNFNKKQTKIKKKAFYAINLRWFDSLASQAKELKRILELIQKERQEPIVLVGHSVGGVVARLYLLSPKTIKVTALITIASPHLGSPWADFVWNTLQSPMGDFISLMEQNKWDKANHLLWDISYTAKNNLIHWMNKQNHPKLNYISIIHRARLSQIKLDIFVTENSQNMNYIPALRGKSKVYGINSRHELNRKDGILLVWLLDSLENQSSN